MSALRALYRLQYDARQRVGSSIFRLHRRRNHRPGVPPLPKRVLIVLAGHIGDTVMCTPVLMEARRTWPTAEIVVLGRTDNIELLSGSPVVDRYEEVIAFPFSLRRMAQVGAMTRQLRQQAFDIGILLLGDQFAKLLADANIPIRVGVAGSPSDGYLTHRYSLGPPRRWGPAERLRSLSALGLPTGAAPRPRLWPTDSARERVHTRLTALGIPNGSRVISLHPFGSTKRQWWPLERLRAVGDELHRSLGATTILIGGRELVGRFEVPRNLVNFVGALSVSDLVALTERSAAVVTTDSGPYHIAGALGRPTVGLFRGTRPEYSSLYSPSTTVLMGRDAKCAASCGWQRCVAYPCRELASLEVDRVVSSVAELL